MFAVRAALVGISLLGCGSGANDGVHAGRSGGNDGAGGRDAVGGGDAGSEVPDPVGEATLTLDPFVVEPGGETVVCQKFENPFGESVLIREFEAHMTPGSHHLLLNQFQEQAPNLALERCTGLEGPTGSFATQSADDKYTYPEGIAAELRADTGLCVISHYLNTTTTPLTPTVSVTMRLARKETVMLRALTSFLSYVAFEIPPLATKTVASFGGVAEDAELLWLVPHMHSHGKHFAV